MLKDKLSGLEFNLAASNYHRAFDSNSGQTTIVDNGNGEFSLKFFLKENQLFPDLNIKTISVYADTMDGNGFYKEISDSFSIDINNDSSVIHPHTIDNLIMENTASGDNSLVCKVSGQIGGDVSTIDHINLGIILNDVNGTQHHQIPGYTFRRQDISEDGYFEKSLEFFNLTPPLLDYSPNFLGAVIVNSDGHINRIAGEDG